MKVPLHIVARPAAPAAAIPVQPNAAPPPSTTSQLAAPAPKRTLSTRFTHRPTIAVLAVLACGLTAWSLVFRLPRLKLALPVQARVATLVAPGSGDSVSGLSTEEIRNRVQQVRSLMLPDREALLPVLASLEQTARSEGWSFGVTVKPPLAPLSVAPGISRIPVAVVLRSQPAASDAAPPFVRLAAWLRQISLLSRKAEVSSLVVRASPQGISEVELDLVFWALNPNEKAAPK